MTRTKPIEQEPLTPPVELKLYHWLPSLLLILAITYLDWSFSLSESWKGLLSCFQGLVGAYLGRVLGAHQHSSAWIRQYLTRLKTQSYIPNRFDVVTYLAILAFPFILFALYLYLHSKPGYVWISTLLFTTILGEIFYFLAAHKPVIRVPPLHMQLKQENGGGAKRKSKRLLQTS